MSMRDTIFAIEPAASKADAGGFSSATLILGSLLLLIRP
jgi:hypothetical protein